MKTKYKIFDWAHNDLFQTMFFDSFEDAWEFFMASLPDNITEKQYNEECGEIEVLEIEGAIK